MYARVISGIQGDDGTFQVYLQEDGSPFNRFDVVTHESGGDSTLVFLRVNNVTFINTRSTQTFTFDVRFIQLVRRLQLHTQNFIHQNIVLTWWLHWLSVGLVIERSLVRLPARALSSQLGQLSLPSLRGR